MLEKLLLLDVLLLLLMAEMLLGVLGVCVITRGVLHHLIVNVPKIFKHVDKLHSLSLHICLVCVSNKIHVDFAVSSSPGTCFPLFLLVRVERVFFIKVVKVFIGNLARDRRLVRCNLPSE